MAGSRSYTSHDGTVKNIISSKEKSVTPPESSAFFADLKPFLFYTVSVKIETSFGTGERKAAHFTTLSSGKPVQLFSEKI